MTKRQIGSLTVQFDSEIPAAYIYLPGSDGAKSKKTKQVSPGIIVDFNSHGKPLGIELLGHVDLDFVFNELSNRYEVLELKQLEHKRHILEEILSSPIHH